MVHAEDGAVVSVELVDAGAVGAHVEYLHHPVFERSGETDRREAVELHVTHLGSGGK